MRFASLRSLLMAGFSLFMSLAVLGGLAQFLIPSAGAQGVPPTLDRLPVIFVSYPDSARVRSFDFQGQFMGEDDFSENFGPSPADIEGLVVDYVTLSGMNNPDANVVVADTGTGKVFAGIGLTGSSYIGFAVDGDFEDDDMIFTGNVDLTNDGNMFASALARPRNEILIAKPDEDQVDFYRYAESGGPTPLHFAGSLDVDIDPGGAVIAADLLQASGFPGQDELVFADASTRKLTFYTFEEGRTYEIPTVQYRAGDKLAVGNIDGLGFDEIVIARPGTGGIEIYQKATGGAFPLLAAFNAGFGPNDAVAVADITGNGVDEVIVADADSGMVTVYTYNMLHNPATPNDEIFTLRSFDADFTAGSQLAVVPVRYPDYDGDGLYEHWEERGLDVNDDGRIDLDLPGMGADPRHKDLFVELDWIAGEKPDNSEIQKVIDAFANAPINAGRVYSPDQRPGINLRIDTGNLGGGNQVPYSSSTLLCSLSDTFYAIKAANFDPARRLVFRYGLSAHAACPDGGQGEIGGNDFIENNHEGGTIMHELGHTLGLYHGGHDPQNCKPNYVSVMNYDYQRGIPQTNGSSIIDYSPPRSGVGRGTAPLPTLDENALDESFVLDPGDPSNRFIFTNAKGQKITSNLNAPVDWDGDGDYDGRNLRVNIDDANSSNFPSRCDNEAFTKLEDHDDWSSLWLPIRAFGEAADGAVNPTTEEELTLEELDTLQEELRKTDLSVDIEPSSDPVVAGTELTYTITVQNNGPNPADLTQLSMVLPSAAEFVAGVDECELSGGEELLCELGTILAGENRDLSIIVAIDAGAAYEIGPGEGLMATASVTSTAEFFNDPEPENNSKSIETDVVAEVDLNAQFFINLDVIPRDVLLEDEREFPLRVELYNNGPSAPVDVELVFSIEASPEVRVTEAATNPTSFTGLGLKKPEYLTLEYSIACLEPGTASVTFSLEGAPVNANDPDSQYNTNKFEMTVNCVVPVAVNIQPGDFPNVIDIDNLTGDAPLAVLTTAAGEYNLPLAIDATRIDASSLLFGRRDLVFDIVTPTGTGDLVNGVSHADSFELDDETKDGDLDAVMRFKMAESRLRVTDTEACVRGILNHASFGRVHFFGCDEVVPPPDVCAHAATGELMASVQPHCTPAQRKIVFELDGPVNLCIDRSTGKLYANSTPNCPGNRLLLVMPEQGPVEVCANNFTAQLRWTSNGKCSPTEYRYVLE